MPMNTNNEMDRMQQEAIRRVQEMQSRARRTVETSRPQQNAAPANKEAPRSQERREHGHEQEHEHHEHNNSGHTSEPQQASFPAEGILPGPAGDILKSLMKDSEKTLILLLILLLVGEECDMGLVLALMYLII